MLYSARVPGGRGRVGRGLKCEREDINDLPENGGKGREKERRRWRRDSWYSFDFGRAAVVSSGNPTFHPVSCYPFPPPLVPPPPPLARATAPPPFHLLLERAASRSQRESSRCQRVRTSAAECSFASATNSISDLFLLLLRLHVYLALFRDAKPHRVAVVGTLWKCSI